MPVYNQILQTVLLAIFWGATPGRICSTIKSLNLYLVIIFAILVTLICENRC